jgi:hypothetical protein
MPPACAVTTCCLPPPRIFAGDATNGLRAPGPAAASRQPVRMEGERYYSAKRDRFSCRLAATAGPTLQTAEPIRPDQSYLKSAGSVRFHAAARSYALTEIGQNFRAEPMRGTRRRVFRPRVTLDGRLHGGAHPGRHPGAREERRPPRGPKASKERLCENEDLTHGEPLGQGRPTGHRCPRWFRTGSASTETHKRQYPRDHPQPVDC